MLSTAFCKIFRRAERLDGFSRHRFLRRVAIHLVAEEDEGFSVHVIEPIEERGEENVLLLPREALKVDDEGLADLDEDFRECRSAAFIERQVLMIATKHQTGMPGDLPSALLFNPHQSPFRSIAPTGTPAATASSKSTRPPVVLPAPELPSVTVRSSRKRSGKSTVSEICNFFVMRPLDRGAEPLEAIPLQRQTGL